MPPENRAEAIRHQSVGILGLGKTGFESAAFLRKQGAAVWGSELRVTDEINAMAAELRQQGIAVELGSHDLKTLAACDWILISPGIPPYAEIYREIQNLKIPVYSEIEVASWFCPTTKIVAVTGTAGKTTVATLLYQILKASGRPVVCCGNIGTPWIAEIQNLTPDHFVVLELSSFQLKHCRQFHPQLGIVLNISANHLDWHPDLQDYAASKFKIFENQTNQDFALLQRQDFQQFGAALSLKAKTAFLEDEPTENLNWAAVRSAARLLQCDTGLVDQILKNFQGLEHRFEIFGVWDGVTYINDSKCTTVASLRWALEKLPDKSAVLIAGGKPKSSNFGEIKDCIAKRTKAVIVIGQAAPLMMAAWSEAADLYHANDLTQAVTLARSLAARGGSVLLSPACASFDMFKNYEERGRLFKSLCSALMGEPQPAR